MVDKITKALNKFTKKEKELVKILLLKINNTPTFIPPLKGEGRGLPVTLSLARRAGVGLDLKKLKGRNDIYRIRKGKIRIIYRVDNKQIYLLAIERRSENTYKDI